MTSARRVTALAAALLLAGCGGGGGSAPATPHAAAPAPSPSGAIATAKMTIKFPATFFRAKIASKTASAVRTVRGARKQPAYVNPQGSNVFDIWVNGNHVVSDTITDIGGGADAGTLNGDGSVNLSFPIYTTSAQQIAVVETDTGLSSGNILALGETDIAAGTFNVGDTLPISISLAMNAAYIGVMSDPANANGDAQIGSSFTFGACIGSDIYPFAADFTGGATEFVANTGLGTAIPSLTSWKNLPGTFPLDILTENNNGQSLGYFIDFNDSNQADGIQMTFNVLSPAAPIANDLVNSAPGTGAYPGLELLLSSNALPVGAFETLVNNNQITATFSIFQSSGC